MSLINISIRQYIEKDKPHSIKIYLEKIKSKLIQTIYSMFCVLLHYLKRKTMNYNLFKLT